MLNISLLYLDFDTSAEKKESANVALQRIADFLD